MPVIFQDTRIFVWYNLYVFSYIKKKKRAKSPTIVTVGGITLTSTRTTDREVNFKTII